MRTWISKVTFKGKEGSVLSMRKSKNSEYNDRLTEFQIRVSDEAHAKWHVSLR